MNNIQLKAIKNSSEINLNQIATHFGISQKYNWEDVLVLDTSNLKGIINQTENKYVHLFYFGSMVFVNMEFHEINDFIRYLQKIEKGIATLKAYTDDYSIDIDIGAEMEVTNEKTILKEFDPVLLQIISTVIARSVALDMIEADMEAAFDKVEDIIENLNKGRLSMNDKEMAQTSSRILRFKYNTLSYIMLLEKPAILWDNEDIDDIYLKLTKLFELKERYEKIKHKTETLLDITDVFSGIAHANRGAKLEWIVIILITFEILITILEKMHIL